MPGGPGTRLRTSALGLQGRKHHSQQETLLGYPRNEGHWFCPQSALMAYPTIVPTKDSATQDLGLGPAGHETSHIFSICTDWLPQKRALVPPSNVH